MTKKKKDATVITLDGANASKVLQKITAAFDKRPYEIIGANIKDDFCHHSYTITEGVGAGFTHNVKGTGIVDPDMLNAFAKLNVHLAVIDDVFKHSNIEIEDIDTMHTHELTVLYNVIGIKLKGSRENQSVVLIGTKYISCTTGRIEIETPKIQIDKLSSYRWYNELETAIQNVLEEVALYMEGKYTMVEVQEAEDTAQPTIDFNENVNKEESGEEF